MVDGNNVASIKMWFHLHYKSKLTQTHKQDSLSNPYILPSSYLAIPHAVPSEYSKKMWLLVKLNKDYNLFVIFLVVCKICLFKNFGFYCWLGIFEFTFLQKISLHNIMFRYIWLNYFQRMLIYNKNEKQRNRILFVVKWQGTKRPCEQTVKCWRETISSGQNTETYYNFKITNALNHQIFVLS